MSQFKDSVGSFFDRVRRATQEAAVGLAETALNEILYQSPQYSGQFVANWQLTPYAPSFVAYDDPLKFYQKEANASLRGDEVEPYSKGDEEAIQFAKMHAVKGAARARMAPLGTPIFLSNSSTHDEAYAWKIENGQIQFRPENPNADRVVQRGAFYVRNRYKHIDAAKLANLRKTQL